MKSHTKTLWSWANLMEECTTINIGNNQVKPNIIWTSQNLSKLLAAKTIVVESITIFINKGWYASNTHFNRLNILIHWVFMFQTPQLWLNLQHLSRKLMASASLLVSPYPTVPSCVLAACLPTCTPRPSSSSSALVSIGSFCPSRSNL